MELKDTCRALADPFVGYLYALTDIEWRRCIMNTRGYVTAYLNDKEQYGISLFISDMPKAKEEGIIYNGLNDAVRELLAAFKVRVMECLFDSCRERANYDDAPANKAALTNFALVAFREESEDLADVMRKAAYMMTPDWECIREAVQQVNGGQEGNIEPCKSAGVFYECFTRLCDISHAVHNLAFLDYYYRDIEISKKALENGDEQ